MRVTGCWVDHVWMTWTGIQRQEFGLFTYCHFGRIMDQFEGANNSKNKTTLLNCRLGVRKFKLCNKVYCHVFDVFP